MGVGALGRKPKPADSNLAQAELTARSIALDRRMADRNCVTASTDTRDADLSQVSRVCGSNRMPDHAIPAARAINHSAGRDALPLIGPRYSLGLLIGCERVSHPSYVAWEMQELRYRPNPRPTAS